MSRRSSLIAVMGRSLTTQLDRLRVTLDSLGQRLREAVTHAVGETVGAVVRHTLRVALADHPAREEEYTHTVEPRYRDPPPRWDEPEEKSPWNQPSWDSYSGWPPDEGRADEVTYPEEEPAPDPERHRGTAAHLIVVGCQALTWWLRGHSGRRPLLAAFGVAAACGVAVYVGGPLVIASVSLAGGALGLATLVDVVRSGAQALAGSNALH
jgi:hypothetical protein